MMNAQDSSRPLRRLAPGRALHLGRLGGELAVIQGRVWLTRNADLGDHVVEPGERLRLAVGENAVIEALHPGQTITLRWSPRRQSIIGAVLAQPLRGLAICIRLAATGLAGLARHAETQACRARGRIVSS